jgi:hypothetical protein
MKKRGSTKGKKAAARKDLSVRRSTGRAVKGGEVNNPITQAPSQRLIPNTIGSNNLPPMQQSPVPGAPSRS